jgi:hypothetical protein
MGTVSLARVVWCLWHCTHLGQRWEELLARCPRNVTLKVSLHTNSCPLVELTVHHGTRRLGLQSERVSAHVDGLASVRVRRYLQRAVWLLQLWKSGGQCVWASLSRRKIATTMWRVRGRHGIRILQSHARFPQLRAQHTHTHKHTPGSSCSC